MTAPASPSPGGSPAGPTAKSPGLTGEFKDAITFRAFGLVLGGYAVGGTLRRCSSPRSGPVAMSTARAA